MLSSNSKRCFLIVFLYALGMAYVEAAVVVYLREIFYPEGFSFPIKLELDPLGPVELVREGATMVMLLAVAWLAGRTKWQRFSYFIFAFGVWDIFYYVFLKLTIGWPSSLLTWDLLFLIPVPWVGPVIAPALLALTMCLMGMLLVWKEEKTGSIRVSLWSWLLLAGSALLPFLSFIKDYESTLQGDMPGPYPWSLLIAGELLWALAMRRILLTPGKTAD
jgi:hypothetical protein